MVNEFKVITVMNEAMLKLLKDKGSNFEENMKIKEYLKDEAFFFKINKDEAFEILRKIGVNQIQLEKVYEKLTSPNLFYDLLQKGIIKENDDTLIVKYDSYRT